MRATTGCAHCRAETPVGYRAAHVTDDSGVPGRYDLAVVGEGIVRLAVERELIAGAEVARADLNDKTGPSAITDRHKSGHSQPESTTGPAR